MKTNQVACWIFSLMLLGSSAGLALAQERTNDPLADPQWKTVQKPDRNSGVQERTQNPLSDSANKPAPEKPKDTQTKNPLSGEASRKEQETPAKREAQLERNLPKNFMKDQFAIWTSPARVRTADSLWLVPFLGVTAGFIATDRAAVSDMPSAP